MPRLSILKSTANLRLEKKLARYCMIPMGSCDCLEGMGLRKGNGDLGGVT